MISNAFNASISTECQLGSDVVIGECSRIKGNAQIGDRTILGDHVKIESGAIIGADNVIADGTVIKSGTRVGNGNQFGEYCIVGGLPLVSGGCEAGNLQIGNENVIREFATIQLGTGKQGITRIGDQNFLMPHAQVGHDSSVGSGVTLTNNSSLCGHVTVEDRAVLGLNVTVHQHCRIGMLAMVGAMAYVSQDIAPFMLVDGRSGGIVGLNRVGLRRNEISADAIRELKLAYRLVFRSQLSKAEYLEHLSESKCAEVQQLVEFIHQSKRGVATARRNPQLNGNDNGEAADKQPATIPMPRLHAA